VILFLLIGLVQGAACEASGRVHLQAAAERAARFDVRGAADAYAAAAADGCADASVAAHYLRGLAAARDAYDAGGSPDSLAAVVQAMAALEPEAARPGLAQIARVVLQAAAAAAQSERGEMALLLDHATRLELVQIEARQPPLPGVTAHEVAGDLWLQVHRYAEAGRAYELAGSRTGRSHRVVLGLARVAARLQDDEGACRTYRELLQRLTAIEAVAERAEAEAFVARDGCVGTGR
jgi:hypothetical protein